MRRRFASFALLGIPFLVIPMSVSFDSVAVMAQTVQEEELCDPIGRLISGLDVNDGEELLCEGDSLPGAKENTTVTAVCFNSQSVEEIDVVAGEIVFASALCSSEQDVVQCGDGICFAPRGIVSSIKISLQEGPSITLLDWDDVPGSDRYLIEVFDGSESIFRSQEDVSQVETDLPLSGDETVAVTAISSTSFIIGYGSFSASQ